MRMTLETAAKTKLAGTKKPSQPQMASPTPLRYQDIGSKDIDLCTQTPHRPSTLDTSLGFVIASSGLGFYSSSAISTCIDGQQNITDSM